MSPNVISNTALIGTTALGQIPCSPNPTSSHFSVPTEVTATIPGLTSETTYHYRIVVGNANGSSNRPDRMFTPHRVANLTTDPATEVEATTATLNGSFIGSGEDTEYYFEYGTDTDYGHSTPVQTTGPVTGPNLSPVTGAQISGLQAFTTYHYRIVATNSHGHHRWKRSNLDDCNPPVGRRPVNVGRHGHGRLFSKQRSIRTAPTRTITLNTGQRPRLGQRLRQKPSISARVQKTRASPFSLKT